MPDAAMVPPPPMAGGSVIVAFLLTLFRSYASQSLSVQLLIPLLLSLGPWMVYNWFFRLRGVPGPILARLGIPGQSALWAIQLEWVWKVQDLHERYGPVVRIGPNQVDVSSSPMAVQKLYAHGSPYLKPQSFYDAFVVTKGYPSLFSVTDPHAHAVWRRGVSAAYALNYLVKLEECIDPLVDRLVLSMGRKMDKRRVGTKKSSSDAPNLQSSAEKEKERHPGDSDTAAWTHVFDMTKVTHLFAMDAVGELVSCVRKEGERCARDRGRMGD